MYLISNRYLHSIRVLDLLKSLKINENNFILIIYVLLCLRRFQFVKNKMGNSISPSTYHSRKKPRDLRKFCYLECTQNLSSDYKDFPVRPRKPLFM